MIAGMARILFHSILQDLLVLFSASFSFQILKENDIHILHRAVTLNTVNESGSSIETCLHIETQGTAI